MNESAAVSENTPPQEAGFQRGLGLFDATMVVVGSMIGSGIFIVSADMARVHRQSRLAARRLARHRRPDRGRAPSPTASWPP